MALVLVVESEQSIQGVLEAMLTEDGHKAVFRSTAEEALTYCLRSHPDLVVVDVYLPGMSGLEMISRVRRRKQEVRIIACVDVYGMEGRALAAGADSFVQMPFHVADFLTTVRTILADIEGRRQDS